MSPQVRRLNCEYYLYQVHKHISILCSFDSLLSSPFTLAPYLNHFQFSRAGQAPRCNILFRRRLNSNLKTPCSLLWNNTPAFSHKHSSYTSVSISSQSLQKSIKPRPNFHLPSCFYTVPDRYASKPLRSISAIVPQFGIVHRFNPHHTITLSSLVRIALYASIISCYFLYAANQSITR
jgi:hypothetical protein